MHLHKGICLLFVVGLAAALAGCGIPTSTPNGPVFGPTAIVAVPESAGDNLPTIEIVSPADEFQSRAPIITFEWDWDELPEGHKFAVLLWREGNPPAVIELTEDRYFYAGEWLQLHGEGPGVFYWQVLYVQLRDGQPPLAKTQMKPRRFSIESMAVPTPLATPVNLMGNPSPIAVDTTLFTHARIVGGVPLVTAIDFAPDGRIFFTQKEGAVRVIANGELQPDPVITFPVAMESERGLIGIAIDPDFETNHFIWVSLTRTPESGQTHPENQIIRFVENDGHGTDPEVALSVTMVTDSLAHTIGNIHFGPDGMLYLGMGDNGDRTNAQNPETVPGKIHRFQPTVPLTVPDDNVIPGNSMVAMGFRNPWGYSFDPVSDAIFVVDNGSYCDDEVNRVAPGGNYGWHPSYRCDDSVLLDAQYDYDPPIAFFTPTIAPSGMAFYTGNEILEWRNDLFFCAFLLGDLVRLQLNEDRTGYMEITRIDLGERGCFAAVADGPDGTLYYSTAQAIFHLIAP